MAFWDLIQYALTLQLIIGVATHVRRLVTRPSSLFSVVLCYLMSLFCHLLNLSFVSYFGSNFHDNYYYSGKEHSSNEDKVEMVFAMSSFSVSLLAFSFLVLLYVAEAAMWCKTSFIPLIKSIKVFYHKHTPGNSAAGITGLQPMPNVVAPGIDLRGRLLGGGK